jgi:prepilin-type N-terminal cleavage/methylation domain-containing protein
MNEAFTVVELLISIVIVAVISAFAIPKFVDSLEYSQLVARKTELLLIRSTIQENRNQKLMNKTVVKYEKNLNNVLDSLNITDIWNKTNDTTYEVEVAKKNVVFKYDLTTGSFVCLHISQDGCKEINR